MFLCGHSEPSDKPDPERMEGPRKQPLIDCVLESHQTGPHRS